MQDHPRRSPSTTVSNPVLDMELQIIQNQQATTVCGERETTSRLLILPQELRDRIWVEVLVSTTPVNIHQSVIKHSLDGNETSPGEDWEEIRQQQPPTLLHVCRQIRLESWEIYYKQNVFCFAFHMTCKGVPGFKHPYDWLKSIGPEACAILQRVDIDLSRGIRDSRYDWEPESGEYLAYLSIDDRTATFDISIHFSGTYSVMDFVTFLSSDELLELKLRPWIEEIRETAKLMKRTPGFYCDSRFQHLVWKLAEMKAYRTVGGLRRTLIPNQGAAAGEGVKRCRECLHSWGTFFGGLAAPGWLVFLFFAVTYKKSK